MEDVYCFIATNNRDTRNRVERAMRVTREQANKNIKEYFNYNFRICNKTLLHLLKLELKKDEYNKEERMRIYALDGLITFDEYDKYLTKKWKNKS